MRNKNDKGGGTQPVGGKVERLRELGMGGKKRLMGSAGWSGVDDSTS